MIEDKKLIKDLKLNDISYYLNGVTISEYPIISLSKAVTIDGFTTKVNGHTAKAEETTFGNGCYFLNKEDLEVRQMESLEKAVQVNTEDLVKREENLKTKIKELEELKKKYNK